jgi:hypothetical protein
MRPEWLCDILQECRTAITHDWEGVWAASVGRIDPEYLVAMSSLFIEVAREHSLAPAQLLTASPRLTTLPQQGDQATEGAAAVDDRAT